MLLGALCASMPPFDRTGESTQLLIHEVHHFMCITNLVARIFTVQS